MVADRFVELTTVLQMSPQYVDHHILVVSGFVFLFLPFDSYSAPPPCLFSFLSSIPNAQYVKQCRKRVIFSQAEQIANTANSYLGQYK